MFIAWKVGMSDKELPELEPGHAPLIVYAIVGLVVLFFVGLIVTVLRHDGDQKPAPVQADADPDAPQGLKEPSALLGPDEKFRVRFETTAGPFVVEVQPEWAPRGATQFRELVQAGFYDDCRFFRIVPDFVVQFGINGNPAEQKKWKQPIPDDPVGHSNSQGTLTFATSGKNTRTTQLFISLKNNGSILDGQGFSPFGQVVEGMENVEKINAEYGEQPSQQEIESSGNSYLTKAFPRLDFIKSAKIVP
jgi:cyclophilin family peptidyl-prolyl cis-trans isomerase